MVNFKKVVIILRGVSGGGRSTFADYLLSTNISEPIICCADDYFTDNKGQYNFDASKLRLAHQYCQRKFLDCLENGYPLIIQNNTNTKESDYNFYLEAAEKFGYSVFSLVVENRHGGTNVHNVPEETLQRQQQNIINSLKLR